MPIDWSKVKGFADLGDEQEDERIRLIVATANGGRIVGVVVDDEPGKPERYIRKITECGARVIDREPGPVPKTVTIRVGPKES